MACEGCTMSIHSQCDGGMCDCDFCERETEQIEILTNAISTEKLARNIS